MHSIKVIYESFRLFTYSSAGNQGFILLSQQPPTFEVGEDSLLNSSIYLFLELTARSTRDISTK